MMDEVDFHLEDLKSKFRKLKNVGGYDKYYLYYSGGKDSHFLY
jgi:PP-loop superfamily ATP-utilizing enzyme